MKKIKLENKFAQKYARVGIIAAIVIVVAALGIWGVSALNRNMSVNRAIADVSADSVSAADLRIAVIRMDAIQTESSVIKDLRKQRESYEVKLRDELTAEQKALEKEKTEIEKSQDVLSREALQRRAADWQARVTKLQRKVAEGAQGIEMSFQKALTTVQEKHLDPIIEGIIAKKNLSLVIDGRFARTGKGVENLDITQDVINALNKKVSSIKMDRP